MRFCVLRKNSRWLPKVAEKQRICSRICRYPMGPKFCQNCSILHCFQDKCAFAFYAEIQRWMLKLAGKRCLFKVASRLLHIGCGSRILSKSLYLTPFLRYVFLRFTQKFKMAAKGGVKMIFVKSRQYTLDTLGLKISKKSLTRLRR